MQRMALSVAAALAAGSLAVPGCGDSRTDSPALDGPLVAPAYASSRARAGPSPGGGSGHRRVLELLRGIRDRSDEENEFQGTSRVREFEMRLANLPPDAPAAARWRLLAELGDAMVCSGRVREGLERFEEADALLPSARGAVPRSFPLEFQFRMATAWLQHAETEEGPRKALGVLAGILEETEPRSRSHLHATWLHSVASRALGEYPDRVPQKHRIPPSWFEGDGEFPRFEDVAGRLGLDRSNLAGSVAADDFDEDGDVDLFVSTWDTGGQLRYHRNEGDGTFTDRSEAAGLAGLFGGLNMIQGDYDGDGFTDLLVLRGGWLGPGGRHPDSLLRNNGDGTFTDRLFESGLGKAHFPAMTAVWTDYDNDGRLDLFVGNEADEDVAAPCQLFHNDGDGKFTDRAAAAGVTNDRHACAAVAGDFDGDRYPDIYVSNLRSRNRLYRNRRDGAFEDVADTLGVSGPVESFPCWFWDYDNDGALDITVLPFPVAPPDLAAAALGLPLEGGLPRLYRGDGKGGFAEVGKESGLGKPFSPMGCNIGDIDNDGWLDFYAGTGRPRMRDFVPNVLYRNRGGRAFADVTAPSGMGNPGKGHGIAIADLDEDGDLDVFAQMGGTYGSERRPNAVYENPGTRNHWLAVRLRGRRSNRSAIGARIRAEIVEDGRRRSVYRTVGSGASFGANPLRQHLGLGAATRAESLEVFWPATGVTQTFRDVPADRLVEIAEGEDRLESRPPRPVRLGGGARPGPR